MKVELNPKVVGVVVVLMLVVVVFLFYRQSTPPPPQNVNPITGQPEGQSP